MDTLEDSLDETFSIYTRLRFADWKGEVHCYTCIWFGSWKELDCGHFIKRSDQAVRWHENNARPQCRGCNRFKNGMPDVFEEELREEIGDEAVAALKSQSLETKYLDDEEKRALLMHMKGIIKNIGIV